MMEKYLLFILLSTLTPSIYTQSNLSEKLVAYYTFDGNSNDQSGNNNNPVANSAILTNNRFCEANKALRFRGYFNRDRTDIPNSPSLIFNDTLSFSGFFKINNWEGMDNNGNYSSNNGFHPIFAKSHDRSGLWCSVIKKADSLAIYVGNNRFDSNLPNFQVVATKYGNFLQQWTHVGIVLSKNRLQIYLNGLLIKTATISLDMGIANTKPLHFGMYGDTWSGWYPLNGDLDEFRFYKRLLTELDMMNLYQEGEQNSIVKSIQSGRWEDSTTWECGRIPKVTNQTLIQSGHFVDISTPCFTKNLQINGSLEIRNGGNLKTND
ncbi:MAG: LamG domain-containing protein [Bacteroidota bacterium]